LHKTFLAFANFEFMRATPTVEILWVTVGTIFGPHFGFDTGEISF
jgi:hypothetical protein